MNVTCTSLELMPGDAPINMDPLMELSASVFGLIERLRAEDFVIVFHVRKLFVLQSRNKVTCPTGISYYIVGIFSSFLKKKRCCEFPAAQSVACYLKLTVVKIFHLLAKEVQTGFQQLHGNM